MRILYGTDGSEGAHAGVELLNALLLPPGSEVIALTAAAPEEDEQGARVLAAAQQALAPRGTPVRSVLRYGGAAEEILKAAREEQPDLVVVGSRGLGRVARFFLGSVAEEVVRRAPCPVLVARPLRSGLRAAVLGSDRSDGARHAAAFLMRMPLPSSCEVIAATAVPLLPVGGSVEARVPGLAGELRALQQREREESEEHLQRLAGAFRESGRPARILLREHQPAEGLLEIAAETGADLIVVGRQGLGRVDRILIGSVSSTVLQRAECSVLVVPETVAGSSSVTGATAHPSPT